MLGGAGLLVAAGRSRPAAIAAGVLTLMGAASTRFAVWQAGRDSADRT